jgi:hypothetical protein
MKGDDVKMAIPWIIMQQQPEEVEKQTSRGGKD